MAEITVRAIDSALAMEEVQKRLGDDALIISTQRIDGQIEITATDEEVIKSQKENKPFILGEIYRQDNFSAVLDRKVGEAIDIYVNNRLVARGEVVVLEDKLGITMTEIFKSDHH